MTYIHGDNAPARTQARPTSGTVQGFATGSAGDTYGPVLGERVLSIGKQGPDVAALKAKLRNGGYLVDRGNTYTEATHHAVMAFQKVNGLTRDGAAGPQTFAALQHPRRPQISTGAANRIVVDLSDQVLMIVKNNRLVGVSNASSGDPFSADGLGQVTPMGRYGVFEKRPGADKGPLGTLYWPSYFNGGIAVHGAPSVPAFRASHGCVRVPMHLAEYLYNRMPVGTEVLVRA
jgi:lipoprotein-anchoring transpeptidase ErfK/SrfK